MENKDAARMHPTAQLLVETVREMLKTLPFNTIKSESVLQKSGLSRGSMYHHFVNFEDLVETAQIQLYNEFIEDLVQSLKEVLTSCETIEEARAAFSVLSSTGSEHHPGNIRNQRVGVLYSAAVSHEFAKKLQHSQESLTQEWMNLYEMCVAKGWADPSIDARAVAILIQSTTLGRTIDDLSMVHMSLDAWVVVLLHLLDSFFFSKCVEVETPQSLEK
jgi:AcrR family transcriptional regulator